MPWVTMLQHNTSQLSCIILINKPQTRKEKYHTKFPPPECPKGQIFCENSPGYPSRDFLKNLMSNFSEVERSTVRTNSLRYDDSDPDSKFSVINQQQEKETKNRLKNKGNPSFRMWPVHEWFEESPVCDSRTRYVEVNSW